jgi:predicted nuclease of predicted toxin-antitoxin system
LRLLSVKNEDLAPLSFLVKNQDLTPYLSLAASKDEGPSVLQVRTQNVMPGVIGSIVLNAIKKFMSEIQSGSLISIEMDKARVRILPFE